jgi:hypothetical protein
MKGKSTHFSALRGPRDNQSVAAWFDVIASLLLNGTRLVIASIPHQIVELELYYFGGQHLDPFAHRDPHQRSWGRWYFHRRGGTLRGGSFKGLDITIGPRDAFGGVLIRTLRSTDGKLINGCSLCVDHMLSLTGFSSLIDLDQVITDHPVWSDEAPISLAPKGGTTTRMSRTYGNTVRPEEPALGGLVGETHFVGAGVSKGRLFFPSTELRADETLPAVAPQNEQRSLSVLWSGSCSAILATARVGLTLKRMDHAEDKPRYLMRTYRFLTEPSIPKGKLHTIIALHQSGLTTDAIAEVTKSRRSSIDSYTSAYEQGLEKGSFDQFQGRSLSTGDMCRLHGIWQRVNGSTNADES